MIDEVSRPVENIIEKMEKLNEKAENLNKTMSTGNSASETALAHSIDMQMLLNTKASFFNSTVNKGEKFIKDTGIALKNVQKKLQSINSIGGAFLDILKMGRTHAESLKDNVLGIIKKYLSLKSIGTFFNKVIRNSGLFIVGLGVNLAGAVKRFFSLKSIATGFNKIIQRGAMLAQNIGLGIASSIQSSKNAVKAFGATLKGFVKSQLSLKNVGAFMNVADSYVTSKQRIGAINDGSQTNEALQDKVFAAAERSRTSYASMVDIIGNVGLTASDAFANNDELIGFSELLSKSVQIGGGSAEDQQSGIGVVTQAMSKGELQGDDFTTLMRTAPLLAEAISKFTGKSAEELRTLSAEGAITADILKGALFAGATEINNKFAELPRTFGQLFTLLKDRALQAFGPLIETVSTALQSGAFDQLLNGITAGFQVLGSIASGVITFLMNNLDLVKSVLIALGIAAVVFGLQWMFSWIAAAWPILLIIGIIIALVLLIREMGATIEQIVGFIVGIFYSGFALIWNVIAFIWNSILSFAEFLGNIFIDPLYAVRKLFYDIFKNVSDFFGSMVNGIIDGINWIISKVNTFAGTKFALIDHVDSDWIEKVKPTSNKDVLDFSKYQMEMKDFGDAFEKGYDTGAGIVGSMTNAIDAFSLPKSVTDGLGTTQPQGVSPANNIDNINKVGEVGKINDTVDISSEDLKTMRELAEMKSIQNFVSLTPTVSVQTGDIKNGHDIDTIISRIETVLTEQISSSAQGVYA